MRDLKLYTRFSSRIAWVAVVAALAAVVVSAPARAAAQKAAKAADSETARQAASVPADARPEAAQSEPAQSEEEQQNNAFRLEGPVVRWTAKTLHTPVTIVARGFEVVNFLIIALGIGVPLFRFLPRFLRHRNEKLRADVASARKVTEDANARLSAVEAKLASLDEQIGKFRAEVEAEGAGDQARIKHSLEEETARIVASAEQEIGVAAAQARRGLRNFAADLAIDQAAQQMVLTAETDRALIAEFVSDVAANGAAGGGKN